MPTKFQLIALFVASMIVLGFSMSISSSGFPHLPLIIAALIAVAVLILFAGQMLGPMLDIQRGDYLTAKRKYEQAIAKSPRNRGWRLLLALAQCEVELAQPEEALEASSRAVEMAPKEWMPYHVRAIAQCECNKYQEALNDLEKAKANHCPDKYIYPVRAAANFGLKNFNEAIADCDRLLPFYKDRELIVVYVLRSVIDAYSGMFAKAIERCNQGLTLDPKSALLFNNRGHFYTAFGQLEKAKSDIHTAESLRMSPRLSHHLTCAKSQLALKEGDVGSALTYARKALEQRPNSPCALFSHALALAKNGDAMIALSELDRAIAIDKYSGESFWARSIVNQALNNSEQAAQDKQVYEGFGYHPYLPLDLGPSAAV